MYLKELTLRGFKSFASSTTLLFEPGITAVVGPNGSGKSNIVDALTWVMGEQGVKNLRGTSMEDVIFAGTSSRAPLGRAQVQLSIDNTDHTLDIDYSEVIISRTLFRNGGSQYAINGTQCRLLDIQELLSDTGLGQQMHVIVGQGRLDAILRADPSGHRAFIEEAAGILKHRKRKERAQRKLANTEDNIARLDDLLGEIHRQLGPLGRQARISRKAENIQMSLRDSQSRIFAEDAGILLEQLEQTRRELTDDRGRLMNLQRQLSQVKMRITEVESLSSSSNPAMSRANQTWHDLAQIGEKLRSLSSVASERASSLRGQIVQQFGEDPDMLEKRAHELDGQAEGQANVVADARLGLDKAAEERASKEQELASMRQTLTELRKSEQQRDVQISRLRELIAREESAVHLAQSRAKDFQAQERNLNAQHELVSGRVEALELQIQKSPDDSGHALEQARQQLQEAQEKLNQVQEQQRQSDSKRISLQAKADALSDTLESRNASGALQSDEQVGYLGRLTDFIQVKEGWEEAVAHALDAFASAIVVQGRRSMLHALDRASTEHLGKAVLIHARGDGSSYDDQSLQAPCAASLVGPNSTAVDSKLARSVVQAIQMLLVDTCYAIDRQEALEAVEQGGWKQAVTQAGETINAVGAVGGSSLSQSDLSLAAKRDKALLSIKEVEERVGLFKQRGEQAKADRDHARTALDKAEQLRTEIRVKAQQASASMKETREHLDSLVQQIQTLKKRQGQATDEAQTHLLKLHDLNIALAQLQESTADHADFSDLAERERQLESSLNRSREQEVGANIFWNDAKRKEESLNAQAELLRNNAQEARERQSRVRQRNERRRTQVQTVEGISSAAKQLVQVVQHCLDEVAQRRQRLIEESSGHDLELKGLRAQRDGLEPQVQDLQGREHSLDVERERLASNYGQLVQKVSDSLGLTLDELLEQYGPNKPVPVLDAQGRPITLDKADGQSDTSGQTLATEAASATAGGQAGIPADALEGGAQGQQAPVYQSVPYNRKEQMERLSKAKRELEALGKVNPLATEEYDALQRRNQYLNDQRNDVSRSRNDLMALIKDLDATMVQVFKSAFDDTAQAFSKVFSTLFPGGTGRLRLENPDDLLSTGVIVEASPAGKRVKQLSLLSGGERSLTALALLFAIFTARPSPFYVMDEVEAALDDVNLTRLIAAFNALREHAQLIIITHQQRTMGIADVLYGVTMRADGVTTVISQKLDRSDGRPQAGGADGRSGQGDNDV